MQVKYVNAPLHPVTITVIGAGGNGSQIITQLGRINYALRQLGKPGIHVLLMDDDKVSPSNIGRQLFTEGEIGEYKANVLINRINRFYGTEWESWCVKFMKSYFPRTNIYITCTDNTKSRILLHELISKKQQLPADQNKFHYWMDLGNTKNMGQVIVGSRRYKLPTVIDRYPQKKMDKLVKEDDSPTCSLAEALAKQDLFINPFITNVAAKLLWEMLTQQEVNWSGAYVNLETMNIKKIAA